LGGALRDIPKNGRRGDVGVVGAAVHANEREILKAIENDKIWFPNGRQGCDFKQP